MFHDLDHPSFSTHLISNDSHPSPVCVMAVSYLGLEFEI
jgi:hypothetical protein